MVRVLPAALALFVSAASPATVFGEFYAPQPATILGQNGTDPTPDWKDEFPIYYVVFGNNGDPIVRAIIDEGDDVQCPKLKYKEQMQMLYNGKEPPQWMNKSFEIAGHSFPSELPYRFPVKLCGITINATSDYLHDIRNGTMTLEYNGTEHFVPQVKANPTRFLLTGDTGLRIKPTNLGLGKLGKTPDNSKNRFDCNGPKVYGVSQCLTNFTEADLTEPATGSFQGLDEWYFKEIANNAAEENPDLIVYVGDYLYRQGPCPLGANDTEVDNTIKECSAVNGPLYTNQTIENGTVLNFVPGNYGDNWYGWWADWFSPAKELLKVAPIIPARGNHENCGRGGYGYFLFMFPYNVDNQNINYCWNQFEPYNVKFEHEQFLVMDDNKIQPLEGGIDQFDFGNQCPGAEDFPDNTLIPKENPRTDTNQANEDIKLFQGYFQQIEKMSKSYDNNFYVGHRPLFAIACNKTTYVTLDWTLQQSLSKNTLNRISGIINGHMHWGHALEFQDNELPAQMVVGNGGTRLIPKNNVNQSAIPLMELRVGQNQQIRGRVKRGYTMTKFGYAVMDRQDDDDGKPVEYEVTFKTYNEMTKKMEPIDFSLKIPKGPRVGRPDTGVATKTDEQLDKTDEQMEKKKAKGCSLKKTKKQCIKDDGCTWVKGDCYYDKFVPQDWYENPNNGETNKVESVVAADPVAKKANSAASSPQVGTVTKISVTMLAGFVLLLVVVL